MKSSFIAIVSLFIFILGAAVAAPTTLDSTEIVKREPLVEVDVDVFLNEGLTSLVQKNTAYNATATATVADVSVYCGDIIAIIKIIITKCRQLPPGHIYHDTNIIVSLLFEILCEINFTLKLLLSKCGLLSGLTLVIILHVGGLIAILNELLAVIVGVCGPGFLQILLTLILNNCGSDFLIISLGVVIAI